jgi:N-acetylneuraminic acid mutarotase
MRLGPNGEPMFMPQTQNTVSGFWDTQIGQPGLSSNVNALAVSGNNVFVGGEFTTAGSITANRVARYNLTTNTWSSLGTGAQNGVSGGVGALAIDGSGKVYVGGFFTQAGGVSATEWRALTLQPTLGVRSAQAHRTG